MSFRTIGEYYAHIQSIVARSGYSNDWAAIKFKADSRTEGLVYADDPSLRFKDGATLRFYETVKLDSNGMAQRPVYTYHYERPGERPESNSGFFFRYDRDPERAKPVVARACADRKLEGSFADVAVRDIMVAGGM